MTMKNAVVRTESSFEKSRIDLGIGASDWSQIINLAERAEATFEAHGKIAARELVVPVIGYSEVAAATRNGDELTRRKALGLLQCWPTLAGDDLVHALRFDPCPVVRHEAAYYLATLKLAYTIDPLIDALKGDPVDLVRHEAAEALGDMGYSTAIPALEHALSDDSEIVARTARIALQQLKNNPSLDSTASRACVSGID